MGLDEVKPQPCASLPVVELSAKHQLCADELGSTRPISDACQAHICGLQIDDELYCTIAAPDADGDGVGDMNCIEAGSELPRDCDETDPSIAEGLNEVCDGKDNDCDGKIDESVLVASEPRLVGDPGDAIGVPSFNVVGDVVISAFRRENESNNLLHVFDGAATRQVAMSGPITLRNPDVEANDSGFAIAGDESNTFSVFPRAGCQRLSAGRLIGGTLSSASIEAMEGLPDEDGTRECNMPASQRAPETGIVDGKTIVAWLDSERKANCGTNAKATLLMAIVGSNATFSTAESLGEANDREGPTLLPIPSLDMFVLAYGFENRARLIPLAVDEGNLEIGDAVELTMEDEVDEIALALGPSDESSLSFALALSSDCGRNANVSMQRASISRTSKTIQLVGDIETVSSGEEQHQPGIAFGSTPRGYLVAWREGDEQLRAQLFGPDEGSSGDAIDILNASDFDNMAPERLRGLGIAPQATGGFDIVAHVRRGNETGFYATLVGCAGDS